MRSRKHRVLAFLLAVIMLFTGCSMEVPTVMKMLIASQMPVHFSDMEYTRPDVDGLLAAVEACEEGAAGTNFDTLVQDVMDCLLYYHEFMTNYYLAQIRYSINMTDIYWTDEYNYCMDRSAEVSAAVDRMLYTLADSPHRAALESEEYFGAGYFDDYEGDSIWDDTFTALMDREADLLTEYYDLSAQTAEANEQEMLDVYAVEFARILVELVALRQEIAAYAGFESYHAFAYDYYYLRDYTPEQEAAYLAQVRQELVPVYRELYARGISGADIHTCTEEETFAYAESVAENMGGVVLEAFRRMEECGLYDISMSENKYDASFEVYLTIYGEPFVFVNPTGTEYDYLTFVHEFGHFSNDYASMGAGKSIDVAEFFSQGLEYLSLFYGETDNPLDTLQMASSLSVYVEQSAYADFEMRLYSTPVEELTTDRIFGIFDAVCADYGVDDLGIDGRYLITIPHFYIAPCYVFSYVASNDAALQLYQLELAESGAGRQKYVDNLVPAEYTFMAFLESAGLESPFAEGRIQSVAQTFREFFGL